MTGEKRSIKDILLEVYAKAGVLVILLIMCIALGILTPGFLDPVNLMNVIRQTAFYAMIGLGSMMVIVTCGIDMSPGSVLGMTSVFVVFAAAPGEGNVVLWLFIAILTGAAVGFINGSLVAFCAMPPFIVTLGTQIIGRGIALLLTNGRPEGRINENLAFLGRGSLLGIPMPILFMIICCVVTWYILRYTKIGRHIYAVGGNETAAKVSGINTKLVKLFVYTYAGILAGISGLSLTGRVNSGQPNLGEGYELFSIAGAVIGGTSLSGGVGTVYGVVCGSLVIGVLNNGMVLLGLSAYWQKVAQGTIIIVAVLLDQLRKKSSK